MAKLTVTVSPELDERLRKFCTEEYGDVKGALSITVVKALEQYLEKQTAAKKP